MEPIFGLILWLLITLLLGTVAIALWVSARNEDKFLQQAREIMSDNDVTYTDIQNISESWHIERERLLHLLRKLLGEALAGKSEKLKQKADAVRKLLDEHNANTPFSELPENISLQLIALSAAYPNITAQISQLAASLGELYSKNQREITKQKRISLMSFAIGLVGVIVGIVIPLLPQRSNRADTPQVHDSATAAPTSTVSR